MSDQRSRWPSMVGAPDGASNAATLEALRRGFDDMISAVGELRRKMREGTAGAEQARKMATASRSSPATLLAIAILTLSTSQMDDVTAAGSSLATPVPVTKPGKAAPAVVVNVKGAATAPYQAGAAKVPAKGKK